MSTAKKTDEVTNEQKLAQQFIEEYRALCEKHGYQINVNPAFKMRDDGTYSIVLQTSVGKLPEQNA